MTARHSLLSTLGPLHASQVSPNFCLPACPPAVGVDCAAEAAAIGRQWFSWSQEDEGYQPAGDHFRWALAPARTYYPSADVRSWLPGLCTCVPCQRLPPASQPAAWPTGSCLASQEGPPSLLCAKPALTVP